MLAIAGAAIVIVAAGIYWFAPQNLVLDRTVDEALPSIAPPSAEAPPRPPDRSPSSEPMPATSPVSSGPMERARGSFRSLEHATSGTAVLLELSDGSRFLRLEDLRTSNGPDVRVILSDRPPSDSWYGYTDGDHVDLGGLKGNVGSQNYAIPADVDLSRYRSALVWCRRFTVGFGVAPLTAAR